MFITIGSVTLTHFAAVLTLGRGSESNDRQLHMLIDVIIINLVWEIEHSRYTLRS